MSYRVKVGVSNKHLHLSEEDFKTLFGNDRKLTSIKELVQPGQFACDERVELIGGKGSFKNIRIIGPLRPQTQVELSLTDTRTIGIKPEIRESGDLKGTPGIKIIGPVGEIDLKEGVIVAKRHVHLNPEQSEESGFNNGEIVKVKIANGDRKLIFDDVVVRTGEKHEGEFHLDTDEANASGVSSGDEIEVYA
ncbi:MAG: phosphate propanoyltransferase [Clostridiales Family XIII bacterium]|nr:phosphate propanoyltransferase [Clostridiales Family XIII bacterium]